MPSRFPGMDPFIERQVWEDFHHRFIEEVSVQLVPQIRPRYLVRVEKRVYLQLQSGESTAFRADVAVMLDPTLDESHGRSGAAISQAAVLPLTLTLPEPEEEIRESFLTIRDSENLELVTVIEILSPSNKRIRSSGRAAYLSKRNAVIRSDAHLVELDLLRGGLRLPTKEQQPLADYYAFVSRTPQRPKVDVYAWTLRQVMPTIPIPLAADDEDVFVDLQSAFRTVYDRAGYDYSLNYRTAIEPPLPPTDLEWAAALVGAAAK